MPSIYRHKYSGGFSWCIKHVIHNGSVDDYEMNWLQYDSSVYRIAERREHIAYPLACVPVNQGAFVILEK
jgi:hypothetical protein